MVINIESIVVESSQSGLHEMPPPETRSKYLVQYESLFLDHRFFSKLRGYLIASATIDNYNCNFYSPKINSKNFVFVVDCYQKLQLPMEVVQCLLSDRLKIFNLNTIDICPAVYKLYFVLENIHRKLSLFEKIDLYDGFKAPILYTSSAKAIRASILSAIFGREELSEYLPLDWGYTYDSLNEKLNIQKAVNYFQKVLIRSILRDLKFYGGDKVIDADVKRFSDTVKMASKTVGESWVFGRFSDLCKKLKAKMLNENEPIVDSDLFFILKFLETTNDFFKGNTEKHQKVLLSKYSMSKIL